MDDSKHILAKTDKLAVIRRYQERIAQVGATLESMASGNEKKQQIRHQVHASALRGQAPAILDIGCGIGHFYAYLQMRDFAGQYTGYDIVPDYIAAARQAYPDLHFEERNIFEQGIEGIYDTIIMSQVLNNRYTESDNLEVMETALRMSFAHTRQSVSIDMMSSYVDYENEVLYYYDPGQILKIARSITKRVIIRHDYRPYEFCVQLFHDVVEGYVP